jgi:hypothetical protein
MVSIAIIILRSIIPLEYTPGEHYKLCTPRVPNRGALSTRAQSLDFFLTLEITTTQKLKRFRSYDQEIEGRQVFKVLTISV